MSTVRWKHSRLCAVAGVMQAVTWAEGGWENFPLIRPCGATFPQRGEGLESIKNPATGYGSGMNIKCWPLFNSSLTGFGTLNSKDKFVWISFFTCISRIFQGTDIIHIIAAILIYNAIKLISINCLLYLAVSS